MDVVAAPAADRDADGASSRIVALEGIGAPAGAALLADAGWPATLLPLDALADGIRSCAFDAALIDLRAVTPAVMRGLTRALADQPAWSDFPFVLLGPRQDAARLAAVADQLGQSWAVELPAEPQLLRQAVVAALRSRARQRAGAEKETGVRRELAELAAALENRVSVRMAELGEANHQLVREIEERGAAEVRLQESEQLYRYTIELIDQMVWSTEPDGSGVVISPRFYELTGLEAGVLPREAVHPDDYAAAVVGWKAAIESGRSHDHDFRFRMKDGSFRHFRARAAARKDEAGRVLRWYGTFEDIHERTIAAQATADAQERYRLAARATNDAIWDLDLVNDQLWWSPTAMRLFGLGSREMATTLSWWEERLHPDDRARIAASFGKVIDGRRNRWTGSYRFRRRNGSYADILDRGYIIRDERGRAVRAVGAMSDLTERRQTQAEMQRVKAELIHVSRLSAMGALASTLAHELNQPLTAVTGYIRGSRRLLGSVDTPVIEQVQGALEAAEKGALRAGQIVRRLRELVARGNVAVKPEDLAKLLDEASQLAFVDEQLHGVSHRIESEEAARWVEADRIQIQQVLINLVRNAVQAMADRPRREILIATRAIGAELVEISVADTGTGLSDARKAALFSPFDTTKEEGLGIGLSICRTIVEAHGGKIWAENNEEGGATFRFTLPMAEPPEET